jgi:hypothetical protein
MMVPVIRRLSVNNLFSGLSIYQSSGPRTDNLQKNEKYIGLLLPAEGVRAALPAR